MTQLKGAIAGSALAGILAALTLASPALSQSISRSCSSENGFFGSIYSPGWDYAAAYTTRSECDSACWSVPNCQTFYCSTIGYCIALFGSGSGGGGGGIGPSQSNLPAGAACGFDSECASNSCILAFCQ